MRRKEPITRPSHKAKIRFGAEPGFWKQGPKTGCIEAKWIEQARPKVTMGPPAQSIGIVCRKLEDEGRYEKQNIIKAAGQLKRAAPH